MPPPGGRLNTVISPPAAGISLRALAQKLLPACRALVDMLDPQGALVSLRPPVTRVRPEKTSVFWRLDQSLTFQKELDVMKRGLDVVLRKTDLP